LEYGRKNDWNLIKRLYGMEAIKEASLALQIGYRNSIDIDLFGDQPIDYELFITILKEIGKTEVAKSSNNILIILVDDIKVDFVKYRYPLLEKPLDIKGIRMLSKKDIAAMKLNAIAGP